MRPASVLVTGGGFQGLGLIKALRTVAEVRVLVADCHVENVGRYFADAFFPAPPLKEKQELLAHHREAFAARGATAYVSDMPLLELAGDKLLFYRWLLNKRLPCLPIYTTPLDTDAAFPLIGKPRRGWGGRNLHILADRKAFFTLSIDQNEFVWQPFLGNFDEYSVDFSIGVAGDISPLAFRRRIRSMDEFAILCEPGAPRHVRETTRAVLEHMVPLGARGPMNLQILRIGDDCWVSDLNPRAGTSMPLSLTVGINPIAFLLGEAGKVSMADESFITSSRARTLRYLEERNIPDLLLNEVRVSFPRKTVFQG